MYQDLANVLFWGDHKSMFIKWYQLPNVVDQRLPPHMSWITNPPLVCYGERIHPWYATENESTPGMLRITNPPLVCHGSRSSCSVVKLLVLEKISLGQNHRKKSGSRKTWRMGIPKKHIQKPKENQVFFWPQHSPGFRWSRLFSMKLEKNKNEHQEYSMETGCMLRRTMLCYGERFHPWYAPEHESTPGMPRITNPPLVCYGSRIHPWYAKDHECQQSQNSPTHVGYG